MMLSRGNVFVLLWCTKTGNPKIGTILHWLLPDVHIFHIHPSLVVRDYFTVVLSILKLNYTDHVKSHFLLNQHFHGYKYLIVSTWHPVDTMDFASLRQ